MAAQIKECPNKHALVNKGLFVEKCNDCGKKSSSVMACDECSFIRCMACVRKGSSAGGGTQDKDKCTACGKVVYPFEKVTAKDNIYHKSCLKCSICSVALQSSYYFQGSQLRCKKHEKDTTSQPTAVNTSPHSLTLNGLLDSLSPPPPSSTPSSTRTPAPSSTLTHATSSSSSAPAPPAPPSKTAPGTVRGSNVSLEGLGKDAPPPHGAWECIIKFLEYNHINSFLALLRTNKSIYYFAIPRLEKRQYISLYGERSLINELGHYEGWKYNYHDCNCNMYCTCGDGYCWFCCFSSDPKAKCTSSNKGRIVWNIKHKGEKLEVTGWRKGKHGKLFLYSDKGKLAEEIPW